jgi:hypothetical protein
MTCSENSLTNFAEVLEDSVFSRAFDFSINLLIVAAGFAIPIPEIVS